MYLSDLNLYLPFVMLSAPHPNPASSGEQGKEHKATSHVLPSPQPHSNKDLNTFPKLTRALLSMPPLEGWGGRKGLRVARDLFWNPRPGPCVQWAFCGTGRARKPQGITVQPPTLHETSPEPWQEMEVKEDVRRKRGGIRRGGRGGATGGGEATEGLFLQCLNLVAPTSCTLLAIHKAPGTPGPLYVGLNS